HGQITCRTCSDIVDSFSARRIDRRKRPIPVRRRREGLTDRVVRPTFASAKVFQHLTHQRKKHRRERQIIPRSVERGRHQQHFASSHRAFYDYRTAVIECCKRGSAFL